MCLMTPEVSPETGIHMQVIRKFPGKNRRGVEKWDRKGKEGKPACEQIALSSGGGSMSQNSKISVCSQSLGLSLLEKQ